MLNAWMFLHHNRWRYANLIEVDMVTQFTEIINVHHLPAKFDAVNKLLFF